MLKRLEIHEKMKEREKKVVIYARHHEKNIILHRQGLKRFSSLN